jgi:calcineurin-like phosphoesterase family protein
MKTFDIQLKNDELLFLTSDTHFGHDNIIKYCARPFANAEEMNNEIIKRWNSVVRPDDVVVHLGDFAFKNRASMQEILNLLHGRKYLCMGNHDEPNRIRKLDGFRDVAYDEIHNGVVTPQVTQVLINGIEVFKCSHYPMGAHVGGPFFFGHVHTSLIKADKSSFVGSYDVGVDNNDFFPIHLSEAIRKAYRK